MEKNSFKETCLKYFAACAWNYIPADKALLPELQGVQIYEAPLIGIASATDNRFAQLKQGQIIGEHTLLPCDWLATAQTVVSFFFPFTPTIRDGNKTDMIYPSKGWLNGRIEGQHFLSMYITELADYLNSQGYATVAPSVDARFASSARADDGNLGCLYTSNWSERHTAFICGLGTFSLSRGMITELGTAGRFISLVTELPLAPDAPAYSRYDENCIMCGQCVKNCPVDAISLQNGKDQELCAIFLEKVRAENTPYYGCGKCQVSVPCEACNPAKV